MATKITCKVGICWVKRRSDVWSTEGVALAAGLIEGVVLGELKGLAQCLVNRRCGLKDWLIEAPPPRKHGSSLLPHFLSSPNDALREAVQLWVGPGWVRPDPSRKR